MNELAGQIGEKTLFGRTGGAATLAVGMAQIFSKAVQGHWLDLWYHFAIMFEALFILTTLDAGTRVGRYILQDFLGDLWKPLGDTRRLGPNVLASGLMVCGWGYFLVQGVRDPLGGVNSLWPLFGIANQMLAAIALCLATTILLKTQLLPGSRTEAAGPGPRRGRPWLALVAFLPLIWLVAVTFTAGVQKIFDADPRIGFLAQARVLQEQAPALVAAVASARAGGSSAAIAAADRALGANRTLRFNNLLDAVVAGGFLAFVSLILLLSIREWIWLLARRKVAQLCETPPVWLPGYAVGEGKPLSFLGLFALVLALARELSGEAEVERVWQAQQVCQCAQPDSPGAAPAICGGGRDSAAQHGREAAFLQAMDHRFRAVRRCC